MRFFMANDFQKVKGYLTELELKIEKEDEAEALFVVSDRANGINKLIIDCEEPILILEQHIFDLKSDNLDTFKSLLQMNRNLVHGAFVIDDSGKKVIFRDTLQIANLDYNELEASIQSLSLALTEYSKELLNFATA